MQNYKGDCFAQNASRRFRSKWIAYNGDQGWRGPEGYFDNPEGLLERLG
jgi:hypothetical protein